MEKKNNYFSVDDIRKIREYDDKRRRGMTAAELARDVHKEAEEGHDILARLMHSRQSVPVRQA
jgi:hypothetical protein